MQKECERVFVIGLDGAGGGAVKEAQTPNIDRCLARGVWTYSAQTVYPSSSFPAWGALLHGVGPELHQIDETHPCAEDVPWPSFFKLARQAWPDAELASFSCWEPINGKIIEPSCGCRLVSLPDPGLVDAVTSYIRTHDPRLVFVQLDHIDAAGHKHGYGSQAYLEQIEQHDLYVGAIVEAICDAGLYKESLILLTSDHGGHERKHGTRDPLDMTIVWGCWGPGINRGRELEGGVSIVDTAAVVAQTLGLSRPSAWEAVIPPGVLAGVAANESAE